jgi:predicted DNA-binding transcriptional regulator AlpA
MARNSKLIKAVEACSVLKMDITTFLELERNGTLPSSVNIGIGRRWNEQQLLDWYKNWYKEWENETT